MYKICEFSKYYQYKIFNLNLRNNRLWNKLFSSIKDGPFLCDVRYIFEVSFYFRCTISGIILGFVENEYYLNYWVNIKKIFFFARMYQAVWETCINICNVRYRHKINLKIFIREIIKLVRICWLIFYTERDRFVQNLLFVVPCPSDRERPYNT